MDKCNKCLRARLIISENGLHPICTLSQNKALNCMFGKEDLCLEVNYEGDDDSEPSSSY